VVVIVNPVSDYPEVIDDEPKITGRIVSMGRLQPQKRFDRLIDAFSLIADKYPGWFIDIYGEGNERQMLEDLIKSHGLVGRVHLKGESSNVFTEYKRSQFFAFSSDTECFGLVLIEAMACGIPAVSVNCPFGPSEIIEDGVTGLLTKMNANDLAAKMEWMITHEAERQEMGARARKAAARYQIQVVMKDWEKAYASELNT
jgi:glycosyltransferase involved in cell wall biosynthesis